MSYDKFDHVSIEIVLDEQRWQGGFRLTPEMRDSKNRAFVERFVDDLKKVVMDCYDEQT